jgi:hypothetical protein
MKFLSSKIGIGLLVASLIGVDSAASLMQLF